MKVGAAVTTPVGVGYTIGAAVQSDQRATGTRKMVSGSGTSLSSRTTGEPDRSAPQYLSQNTRPKKPGARPWMRHTHDACLIRYCAAQYDFGFDTVHVLRGGVMQPDMIYRLKLDPGTRTLGELLQEREWAGHELERLRREEIRTTRQRYEASKAEAPVPGSATLTLHRLLRLPEVRQLVGLSRSSIYQLKSERRFPQSVRVGLRSVWWRMADVLAWQAQVEKRDRTV